MTRNHLVKDTGDALYDVDRRVLAGLLAASRGPSTIEAGDLAERLAALGRRDPGDDRRPAQPASPAPSDRRLLDEPVLYFDELDDVERAYLTSQRAAITSRISELTGLVAEVRAEGIAMVDHMMT